MNNKKKIFSFGLYREGLKQLRLVGILAFVIFALEAILIPVGQVISYISQENFDITKHIAQSVTGVGAHPILIAIFILFAPIMTITLFGFMNKRNTSDFYHSLPHTRLCMFISFFCAIVSWLVIIILGTTILSIITNLIFFKFFTLLYSSLFMLALNSLVASILVVAATAIAMSISGTTFTNIILSGLIIYLPRFAITLISSVVTGSLPMVTYGHLFPLLSDEYNIVTGTVFGMFNSVFGAGLDIDISAIMSSGSSLLYTFIVAALYTVIAGFLFYRRQSESAARSAPNRFMQAVYRIALTMAFCTIICVVMFGEINSSYKSTFGYVVLYIIALLIYFIYEIVTTKKWKNLLRAIPGLAIVAVLNVGLFFGMYGIYLSQLNYTPSADEIKSVSVIGETPRYYGSMSFMDYVQMKNSDIEITDKDVIKLVSDSLADCVNTYKTRPRFYYQKYNGNGYQGGSSQVNQTYNSYSVKISTDKGEKYRTIFIPSDKTELIAKAMESNSSYKDIWMTLPDAVNNTLNIQNNGTQLGKEASAIYDMMKEELKNASFTDWYKALTSQNIQTASVNLQTQVGTNVYRINIPLYPSIMPKSCEMYYKAQYEISKGDIEKVKAELADTAADAQINMELYLYNNEKQAYDTYTSYYSAKESAGRINTKFLLDNIVDGPVSVKGAYAVIYVYNYSTKYDDEGYDYSESTNYTVTVALKDISVDKIPDSFMKSEKYYPVNNEYYYEG